jgi:DNA-binding transcriptional regulator YhcF (GntR family)
MTAPPVTALPRPPMAGSAISALALADLLGHWPTADGPLYRLLATRIARLADTGELPTSLRLPAERDLAAVLSVSRNTVTAAYQVLRDEGMAESRQGAGTRIVPHRTTPAAVHRANGFFSGLLEDSAVEADLSLAAVDCAPQVAAALSEPETVLTRAERAALTGTSGYFPYGLPELRAAVADHLTQGSAWPPTRRRSWLPLAGSRPSTCSSAARCCPVSQSPWRTRRSPACWTRCTGRARG